MARKRKFVANTKAPASSYAVTVRRKGKTPQKKYPLNSLARARNALARVAQHGTPAEKAAVRRKVHARYPSIKIGKR